MRAGAYALSLLSDPLNVQVLEALEEEPRSLIDLRRAVGSPPQTTLRVHLRTLSEIGLIERRRRPKFPVSVDYELGAPGRELMPVVRVLQAWLSCAPEGRVEIGTVAAKSAVKALVEGWSSNMVRALAARPLSLTELNKLISGLNYPSLERRLGAMRFAGLIEPSSGRTRGTPYAVTGWLRRAVGPLAAAARWERLHAPRDSAPIGRIDVESAFLLTVPVSKLPAAASGDCRLAVELRNNGSKSSLAGVTVSVEEGRVTSCVARLRGTAAAWASGGAAAWIGAVLERQTDRLEVGGDCDLALALLDGLHAALVGAGQRA